MQLSARINLEFASALVVDDNAQALDLLCGVLAAFGLKDLVRCANGEEAKLALGRRRFDLLVTDGQMPELDGYDLVHWLRREAVGEARLTPAMIVTAHTRRTEVLRARDCGANFIVAKPISPKVILERIYWIAKGTRMYVETDSYVGPDRRFRQLGPPAEFPDGRRGDDVSAEVGALAGENMTQEELNTMVAPQRASV